MKYAYKKGEEIYLSNDRPRTNMGSQGDHVTAYSLFKEFIRTIETDKPEELLVRVAGIVDDMNKRAMFYLLNFKEGMLKDEIDSFEAQNKRVTEKIQEIFSKILLLRTKLLSDRDIHTVLKKVDPLMQGKIESALINSNQSFFDELVTELLNEYLEMRNRQIYASFPREGSIPAPEGESEAVKKSLKSLREYSKKIGGKTRLETKDIQMIVASILDVFWYPRIKEDKLLDPTSREWSRIKEKYNKGARPRNNDLRILSFVIIEHINTIFCCFPDLYIHEDAIQKLFFDEIAKAWKMTANEKQVFLKNVEKFFVEEKSFSTSASSNTSLQSSMFLSDHSSDTSADSSFLKQFDIEEDLSSIAEKGNDLDNSNDYSNNDNSNSLFLSKQARSLKQESIQKTTLKNSIPGLEYQVVPGDGHCLFTAVGLYLGRGQNGLREVVAGHIEHNLEQYRGIIEALNSKKTPEEYIKDLRKGVEWADNLEIGVLMQVLDRPIVIVGPEGNIRNLSDLVGQGDPIFVQYNGHNHYDALLLAGESTPKDILEAMKKTHAQKNKN